MSHTITLLRASDPLPPEVRDAALNAGLADDEAYLWQRLSTRQVQVVRAPGDHFTVMTEPNVAALARLLRRSLDEVQAIGEQGWGVLSWAFVADWPSPHPAVAAR
jgi:thioesterase domain-containing protein